MKSLHFKVERKVGHLYQRRVYEAYENKKAIYLLLDGFIHRLIYLLITSYLFAYVFGTYLLTVYHVPAMESIEELKASIFPDR